MTSGLKITTSRISDECQIIDLLWDTMARDPQTITALSTQTNWGNINSPCPHCTLQSQILVHHLPRSLLTIPSHPWITGLLWRDHLNRKTTQIITGMFGKPKEQLKRGREQAPSSTWTFLVWSCSGWQSRPASGVCAHEMPSTLQLKEHFKEWKAFVCHIGLVFTSALWHPSQPSLFWFPPLWV